MIYFHIISFTSRCFCSLPLLPLSTYHFALPCFCKRPSSTGTGPYVYLPMQAVRKCFPVRCALQFSHCCRQHFLLPYPVREHPIIKQGHLPVTHAIAAEPDPFLRIRQIPHDIVLLQLRGIHHPATTGNKINSPFHHHAQLLQILKRKLCAPPGTKDPSGAFHADPRHPKQICIRCPVDLHRETFQMPHRPVLLGIQHHIKKRSFLVQQFLRLKPIKPQQPVCLIQTMLPQKRRPPGKRRQALVLIDLYKSGIEHTL